MSQGTPSIHHLLFADDNFIFAHATREDCETVKEILVCFERALGQQVNFQKSMICFSRNIKRSDKEYLAAVLGVVRVDRHEKYLGLPTFVDQNRRACFSHIKESLWKIL